MSISLAADFTTLAAGVRPAGWTPAGFQAASPTAWLTESPGGGLPISLRLGATSSTNTSALIAPAGADGSLGYVKLRFRHRRLVSTTGEPSGGVGLCVTSRGGVLHPSGFFVRIHSGVAFGQRFIASNLLYVAADGTTTGVAGTNLYPPAPFVADDVCVVELERTSISSFRHRFYREADGVPVWRSPVAIPAGLQGLVGDPAIYYRHATSETQSIPRYESFDFVSNDPPPPSVPAPTITVPTAGATYHTSPLNLVWTMPA
jgi:hypothetical protein